MGWGINFTTDIYLSKVSYPTKMSVEDKIKEYDESIDDCESQIKMYASSTPKDIIPKEWNEEPICWINERLLELFDVYYENTINRYKLSLYLEYLNTGGEIIKTE